MIEEKNISFSDNANTEIDDKREPDKTDVAKNDNSDKADENVTYGTHERLPMKHFFGEMLNVLHHAPTYQMRC